MRTAAAPKASNILSSATCRCGVHPSQHAHRCAPPIALPLSLPQHSSRSTTALQRLRPPSASPSIPFPTPDPPGLPQSPLSLNLHLLTVTYFSASPQIPKMLFSISLVSMPNLLSLPMSFSQGCLNLLLPSISTS